jgi:hypothetical protein
MMNIAEIAPDVYRLSIFVPEINLQFNQFLVKDDEPLLFHTGMRATFPLFREAAAKIIDPAELRWIASAISKRTNAARSTNGSPSRPTRRPFAASSARSSASMISLRARPGFSGRRDFRHRQIPVSVRPNAAPAPLLGGRSFV